MDATQMDAIKKISKYLALGLKDEDLDLMIKMLESGMAVEDLIKITEKIKTEIKSKYICK